MNESQHVPLNEPDMNRIRQEAMVFAGIGLYRYAYDGTILFIDEGAVRIFEIEKALLNPSSLVGKNITDLMQYIGPVGFLREQVKQFGHLRNYEYHFKTNSGKEKWILYDAYLIEDSESEQEPIQVMMRDITAHKLDEEERRVRFDRVRRQESAIFQLMNNKAIAQGNREAAFRDIAETTAAILKSDVVGIWLLSQDEERLECVLEYHRSPKTFSQGIVLEAKKFPSYFKALKQSRVISATDACHDKRTKELCEDLLLPKDIISKLDAAIRISGNVVGAVCHAYIKEKRDWTDDELTFAAEIGDQTAQVIMNSQRQESERVLAESEHHLAELNDCFLKFGTDPEANINRLVSLCGRLMNATCALYNRLDKGLLCSVGQWNTPAGYNPVDKPEGHICYDVIKEASTDIKIVRSLQETPYAETDSNVRQYQLQTYIGRSIRIDHSVTGSLCVVYQHDCMPEKREEWIMNVIGSAIAIEEARRHSQEELATSEAKYRMIADYTYDLEFFRDKEGKLVYISPAFKRVTGYEPEEYLSGEKEFKDFVHPDDFDKAREFYDSMVSERSFCDVVMRGIKKDGTAVYISVSSQPVISPEGEFLGRRTSIRDITDRKRAEDYLRQSEQKFRSLAEQSPNIIFINRGGRIIYANNKAVEMMGYSRDEYYATGFDFMNLIVSEQRERTRDNFIKHQQGEEVPPAEYTIQTKEGRHFDVIIATKLIDFEEDKAILGIITDISEQKKIYDSLIEKQSQQRAILDNMPFMAWIKNMDHKFVAINKVFAEMCGCPIEEVLGKTDYNFFPKELSDLYRQDDILVQTTGKKKFIEEPISDQKETRWHETFKAPIIKDGEIVGTTGFARDITERKQAEEALKFRLEFEKLITNISTRFIDIPTSRIDEEINFALKEIGIFFKVDRSYVFQLDQQKRTMSNTHEWGRDTVTTQRSHLQNLSISEFPFIMGTLGKFDNFYVPRVSDLPEAAATEKEEFTRESIQSLVCVPMVLRQELIGFVGFDSVHQEKTWVDDTLMLLKIIGEMFTNALQRKYTEEALRESERNYRQLVETMSEGLGVQNEQGSLTYVNKTLCKMFGYSHDEIVGRPVTDFLDEENKNIWRRQMEKRRGGTNESYEMEWSGKDGRKVITIISPEALFDNQGNFKGSFAVFTDITERKKMEERLQESEAQYRNTIDSMLDAIHVVDRELNVIIINSTFKELNSRVGLETDVVGKNIFDVFPFLSEPVREEYMRVFSNGKMLFTQETNEIAGKKYITESRKIPIFEKGQVAKVLTVVHDITEKTKVESQLAETQALLLAAIEQTPAGIIIADAPDVTIRLVNSAAVNIRGTTGLPLTNIPMELHPKYWQTFYPDGTPYPAEELPLSQAVLHGKVIKNVEMIIRRPDGESRWVLANASPIRNNKGDVVAGIAVMPDITDIKRAEEKLRLTQFSVDHSAESVFWIRPDGSLNYVNDVACDLLQYSREELLVMNVYDIDPLYPQDIWNKQWQDAKEQKSMRFESIHRRKDGTTYPVEIMVNYIDFEGKEYHCASARDISERKRIQSQIEASLKEKEVLLKEIHHRVKNNLQVISSLLNLQSRYIKDAQVLESFRATQKRVRSMALIHERLYHSKDFAKIDFNQYIQSLIQELLRSYNIHEGRIDSKIYVKNVVFDIDTSIPCGLIINELVANALKYAFPGDSKGEIIVEFVFNSADKLYTLKVKDTGVGFPKKVDFRNTQSLGLQLVNILVDQLAGTIEQRRDKGTEYTIKFKERQR